MSEINKFTYGFVQQKFVDGVCVEQEFVAGDQVDFETIEGDCPEDRTDDLNNPFEMVQPTGKN